jgi:hypothetical protein
LGKWAKIPGYGSHRIIGRHRQNFQQSRQVGIPPT